MAVPTVPESSYSESLPNFRAPSPRRGRGGAVLFSLPARMLMAIAGALIVFVGSFYLYDEQSLILLGCSVVLLVVIFGYQLDYIHPTVAYLVPWLTILAFSSVPLSGYARELEFSTCRFLLATIFAWLLSTMGAPVDEYGYQNAGSKVTVPAVEFKREFRAGITMGFVLLYSMALLNVALAGFVPLISLLTVGDSRYGEFGVPSVYGAFLAFSNALGCLAFYAYLRRRERVYLLFFLSVLAIHLAFITRQNIITLVVETFVIWCLVRRRVSLKAVVTFALLGLTAFAMLGELRSGDIRDLINIDESYRWVPAGFVWLYAYSYFNVLNLENMMTFSAAPYFDGFMWQQLLPSIIRSDVDHGSFLELEALNVASYIYPVYIDIGPIGVLGLTSVIGFLTALVYKNALRKRRFADVATYACLFFCALMSFFVDFWFYLPVIFQIFFFWVFQYVLFSRPNARRVEST